MMPSPVRLPLLLLINGMFKEAVHQEAGHAVVKGCPVSDTRHVRLNSYELHHPHSTDRETEAQEPGNDPACPCLMLATATTAQAFGHQDGGHGARRGGEGALHSGSNMDFNQAPPLPWCVGLGSHWPL